MSSEREGEFKSLAPRKAAQSCLPIGGKDLARICKMRFLNRKILTKDTIGINTVRPA